MSPNVRKALIGAIVFVVITIVVLFILSFLRRGDDVPTTPTQPSGGGSFPADSGAGELPAGSGGGFSGGNIGGFDSDTGNSTAEVPTSQSTLKRIVDRDVVSATTFGSTKDSNLTIRYIEAGTGHVYDYSLRDGASTKVSNTTIPRVQSAQWVNQGSYALLSLLDDETALAGSGTRSVRVHIDKESRSLTESTFINNTVYRTASGPTSLETTRCTAYITSRIATGANNDSLAVRRLQVFLKTLEGETSLVETGVYNEETAEAVIAYQNRYREEVLTPSGLTTGNGVVGENTREHINNKWCDAHGGNVSGGKIAFSTDRASETGSGIVILDGSTGEQIPIFVSDIREWILDWANEETIVLHPAPSIRSQGNIYLLTLSDSAKNDDSLLKVLGPVRALTALAQPNLDTIVYSGSTPKGQETQIHDLNTKNSRAFPINTFPHDKCVWDPVSEYLIYCGSPQESLTTLSLESWYQGSEHFNDAIYVIDTNTDTATLLATPNTLGTPVDLIDPIVSSDGTHLFFKDKKDGSLWMLGLGK